MKTIKVTTEKFSVIGEVGNFEYNRFNGKYEASFYPNDAINRSGKIPKILAEHLTDFNFPYLDFMLQKSEYEGEIEKFIIIADFLDHTRRRSFTVISTN